MKQRDYSFVTQQWKYKIERLKSPWGDLYRYKIINENNEIDCVRVLSYEGNIITVLSAEEGFFYREVCLEYAKEALRKTRERTKCLIRSQNTQS